MENIRYTWCESRINMHFTPPGKNLKGHLYQNSSILFRRCSLLGYRVMHGSSRLCANALRTINLAAISGLRKGDKKGHNTDDSRVYIFIKNVYIISFICWYCLLEIPFSTFTKQAQMIILQGGFLRVYTYQQTIVDKLINLI